MRGGRARVHAWRARAQALDADRSGSIDLTELMSVLTSPDRLPLFFRILDLDHNGEARTQDSQHSGESQFWRRLTFSTTVSLRHRHACARALQVDAPITVTPLQQQLLSLGVPPVSLQLSFVYPLPPLKLNLSTRKSPSLALVLWGTGREGYHTRAVPIFGAIKNGAIKKYNRIGW